MARFYVPSRRAPGQRLGSGLARCGEAGQPRRDVRSPELIEEALDVLALGGPRGERREEGRDEPGVVGRLGFGVHRLEARATPVAEHRGVLLSAQPRRALVLPGVVPRAAGGRPRTDEEPGPLLRELERVGIAVEAGDGLDAGVREGLDVDVDLPAGRREGRPRDEGRDLLHESLRLHLGEVRSEVSAALLADESVRQGKDSRGQVSVLPDGGVDGELGQDDVGELPRMLVDGGESIDERAVPALADETDAPEGGEVLGRGRAGDVEDRRDLADAELVSLESGEDPQTWPVREDLRGVEEAGQRCCRYFAR